MALWNLQTTHTDISSFSDNPELRRELLLWRLKTAAWIIVALAATGFSARPAYRAFRDYRINKNLEAAQTAARLEDWGTARDKARSVLLVRPHDFEAYRIWTRSLGKMGEPRTYMAAAQLFTDSRANLDDRLEALQVMALQAPQAIALRAYASLPKELRNQAVFRAAITPLFVQRGDIDPIEKGLREVMQPDDKPKVRLELLRTLCARPEATRVAEARRIFADLIAAGADVEALAALLILGDAPGGLTLGEPLPDLPNWLKSQPNAKTLHHLLGMHPALEAQPDVAERFYDSAIARFLPTDPGVLGTWLVRHGQAEKAARILKDPAETRSDAYLARLHALLRLKNYSEIEKVMAAPPSSVDLVELEIVRAAMAANRGDRISSEAAWKRALDRAAFDSSRNRFIEIARAAEAFGDKVATEDAWVASVRSGWGQIPLYHDLLPVFASLANAGRSEDLLTMYRTLLRFEPGNTEILNNFYYLALIHGILPAAQVATALAELIEAHPDEPELNSALILAAILDARPSDALALLPRLQACRAISPMMKAALEGTARVLNGETEAGTALLKDVDWRLFIRQERIVFRSVLIKLKISEIPLPELETPKIQTDPNQLPAWRKMLERLEKERSGDTLPALPPLPKPPTDLPALPATPPRTPH